MQPLRRRGAEALHQSLVDNLPLSIMTFDRDGRVTFVNRFHLEHFAKGRLDAAFFLGRRVMDLPGLVSAGLGPALAMLLCLHLGAVIALFSTLPYGKFAHGVFRTAALLRHNTEKRQPNPIGLGADG